MSDKGPCDDSNELEFGTAIERAQVISEIREWAGSFREGDEPMIFLDMLGKTFTPRELAKDMAEETALGVSILDLIVAGSRKSMTSPLEYTKRLMKTARSFPKIPRKDLN